MSKKTGARVAVTGARGGAVLDSVPGQDDSTSLQDVQVQVIDKRVKGWTWVSNDVLLTFGPRIGASGIAVYMMLALHANANSGVCFPSHQVIADACDLSRATVLAVIRNLADVGLISIRKRRSAAGWQAANEYTLLQPGTTEARPRPSRVKKFDSGNDARVKSFDSSCQTALLKLSNGLTAEQDSQEQDSQEQDVSPSAAPTSETGSEHDAMCKALADAVKVDQLLQGGRIGRMVKQLRDAGYNLDDLRSFPAWWVGDAWRAEHKPVPTLDDVLRDIRQAAEAARPAVLERLPDYSQIDAAEVL